MGTVTTVYDVELAYRVKGDAASGLAGIGTAAERAHQSTSSLSDSLKGLVAAAGGVFMIHQAKSAFIDFNKEVENAKISIGAVQLMFGQAGSMQQAMGNAAGVFDRYQEAAKASTATTKEFLDMHMSLGPTFAKFGVGGKQIEDIVQGATVTAPILGERPETFAMDVKQMLQGTVTMRDRSAVSLLSMLNIDREEFNKNTKKDVNFAIETIQKALTSPAIMAARKEFENSFAGVTSTLEDTLQILAGQAGQPLFAAITKEVKRWNEWMEKNKDTVEDIKRRVGEGLVQAFQAVKDAVVFIVDHKDALIALAEVYAGLKIGQGLIGTAQNAVGMYESIGKQISGGIMSQAGIIGAAIGAAIGLGVAAKRTQDEWDDIRSKNFEMRGQTQLYAARGDLNQQTYNDLARKFIVGGAYNPTTGDFDQAAAASILRGSGDGSKTSFLSGQEIDQGMANMYARDVGAILAKGREQFGSQVMDAFLKITVPRMWAPFPESPTQAKQKKDPSVNVTINRVEVASDDPDRFVMGIVRLADQAVGRSGQSRSAIPLR